MFIGSRIVKVLLAYSTNQEYYLIPPPSTSTHTHPLHTRMEPSGPLFINTNTSLCIQWYTPTPQITPNVLVDFGNSWCWVLFRFHFSTLLLERYTTFYDKYALWMDVAGTFGFFLISFVKLTTIFGRFKEVVKKN